jgi:hypothetical protein
VSGADLLAAAVDELYSADPDEFIERRRMLAAGARSAGDAVAAKRIAALRKPTRSAWVVNQLARSAPGAASELAGLGEQLRDAQRSADGEALRELSRRRYQLVGSLVRQALAVSGQQHAPSSALRDEVAATLGAAVADPQVAAQVAAGALAQPVHREGFGPAGVLTVVTSQPARTKTAARPAARPVRRTTAPDAGQAAKDAAPEHRRRQPAVARTGRERSEAGVAEPERGRREAGAAGAGRGRPQAAVADAGRERRRAALAAAENEAAEADRTAEAKAAAEREQENTVRELEEQLAEGRLRLAGARIEARRARAAQRRARLALDRLRR